MTGISCWRSQGLMVSVKSVLHDSTAPTPVCYDRQKQTKKKRNNYLTSNETIIVSNLQQQHPWPNHRADDDEEV